MSTRAGIVHALSVAMYDKLSEKQNVAKGDNWCDMTYDELWMLLLTEIEELRIALATGTTEETRREIADCANFLAMILDKLESPWCAIST
jgi:hypothetical protein